MALDTRFPAGMTILVYNDKRASLGIQFVTRRRHKTLARLCSAPTQARGSQMFSLKTLHL